MHKLLAILLLSLVAMAALVASQEMFDDDAIINDLFADYKRKSRVKTCIEYSGRCKVDAIYRNNCCNGYTCRGPRGKICRNEQCVCQKHDKIAFLFS